MKIKLDLLPKIHSKVIKIASANRIEDFGINAKVEIESEVCRGVNVIEVKIYDCIDSKILSFCLVESGQDLMLVNSIFGLDS